MTASVRRGDWFEHPECDIFRMKVLFIRETHQSREYGPGYQEVELEVYTFDETRDKWVRYETGVGNFKYWLYEVEEFVRI